MTKAVVQESSLVHSPPPHQNASSFSMATTVSSQLICEEQALDIIYFFMFAHTIGSYSF